MFDPEEIPIIRESIRDCARSDKRLLDDLLKEIQLIKPNVRVIKPRTTTSIALVASDGGNNKLAYDPFFFQLIRVSDSYGRKSSDTVSPTTDTEALSERQFNGDGTPKTELGFLMKDLGIKYLYDLSPMIPKPDLIRESPDKVSRSWVQTYRDLWEWAVLYRKICVGFETNTLLVRDGLLRSKIFTYYKGKPLFIEMINNMVAAMDNHLKKNLRVFLVGLAKHSQVLSRYSLVMNLEKIFQRGDPMFARVPEKMEEKSYTWQEFIWKKDDGNSEGEANKFSMGHLYLVRFGQQDSDPVWAIDLLPNQSQYDSEIFGYLLADAINGFPVPFYPLSLQKAHEHAQVVDFDMDILQNEVIKAIKEILPADRKHVIDQQVFNSDKSQNRYG